MLAPKTFLLISVFFSITFGLSLQEDTEISKILSPLMKFKKNDANQVWNETRTLEYLNSLIDKHGARVRQEIEKASKEDVRAYARTQANNRPEQDRVWHVGEAAITKFDKTIFGAMISKLREMWPSSASLLDKLEFQDLGLFFFSIDDTDIFEGL